MQAFIFSPLRTDDLKDFAIPFINTVVHVRSWHSMERWISKDNPEGVVGYIHELGLDIPKEELIEVSLEHNCAICEILDEHSMR